MTVLTTNDLKTILLKNCFEVFNLPLQYNIDKTALNTKYQELQKQLHPDNFIHHPDSTLSIRVSAHINDAYHTLNSPLLKTIALLQQHGITLNLNTDKELPADFLILQIDLYEEIDNAAGNIDKLTLLNQKFIENINALDGKIAHHFMQKDFSAIITDAKKLAFYNKLQYLIDQNIQELW